MILICRREFSFWIIYTGQQRGRVSKLAWIAGTGAWGEERGGGVIRYQHNTTHKPAPKYFIFLCWWAPDNQLGWILGWDVRVAWVAWAVLKCKHSSDFGFFFYCVFMLFNFYHTGKIVDFGVNWSLFLSAKSFDPMKP